MKPYTTRVAPSPTGFMHIGTARTALFSWLAARASGGKFILRIDDTDQARNNEDAVGPIFEGLAWLGLDYDGTFRQSDRAWLYTAIAEALLADGLAERSEDNGAILLVLPTDMPTSWHDEVTGDIRITDQDLSLLDGRDRSDGRMSRLVLLRGGDKQDQATYQFASILDDYISGVDYIIRGVDHIPNTPKQIAIWMQLRKLQKRGIAGLPPGPRDLPMFAHIGLITKDKKKLSKRDGASSLLDYREQGIHPDAMMDFLVRLGWGPKVDDKTTSVLTRDQIIGMFLEGGRMKASPAGLDLVKLAAFQKKHQARRIVTQAAAA